METTSLITWFIAGLALLGAVGYLVGRTRALAIAATGERMHSRVSHHGAFVLCWMVVPAFVMGCVFGILHLSKASVVSGQLGLILCFVLALIGMGIAIPRLRPALRARNAVERVIRVSLFVAATISIMTTIGIVISILYEAVKFFAMVSPWEFLTGTTWDPSTAFVNAASGRVESGSEPKFGSVPVFAGTFMITGIALLVAVPVGLFAAIYLSEYAPHKFRTAAKPMLELLAGIPTVVYGFFAVTTISPIVVYTAGLVGIQAEFQAAIIPGLVMGVMIIPLVSSLSDDVINSVPNSLREGSLALATTRAETIKKVILPAALPGIISAVLLAISRALGETMIVVMAAGAMAKMTANPFEAMTTVTVKMVNSLTGDLAFDSPETLSAFALGLVLFVITLTLNVIATSIIKKYRQRYEL